MSDDPKTWMIFEASHLFRAGDKFKTQFFVMDVVNFLRHNYFPDNEVKVVVLHGSIKEEQAVRYAQALENHGVKVIRMNPIPSKSGNSRWFFKPTYYCHKLFANEIPKGSTVVFIGFHNSRYRDFLEKYHKDYDLSLAAFDTPSKHRGIMTIPEVFYPLLRNVIKLDKHVLDIKAEFKHAKGKIPEKEGNLSKEIHKP